MTHTARSNQGKVALCIAQDDETVDQSAIDSVAEEAIHIPGVKTALVVGFAFAADNTRRERRGHLTVLKAQANQDLRIRDLTHGAQDQAFRLIGEPDIEVRKLNAKGDSLEVKVNGFDTYDPATGQLKSSEAARDIVCWMLDTDHDLKGFYARRIHFPNGKEDDQVQAVKRKLGARINPELWQYVTKTASGPLVRPKSGRVAVRVITTTGVEMTQVIEEKDWSS